MTRLPLLRLVPLALAIAAVLSLAAVRPAEAQGFIANQIENLISTETVQVEIEGLSGALSGNVRIEQLTVSDPDGVFLSASDLALDWSPLALARGNVEIQELSAARIELLRLPDSGPADPEAPAEAGGFALPAIDANIGQIAIAEFVLGEEVAGVPARLAAEASLVLVAETTRLDLSAGIQRLDQPGEIQLTLGFAPSENRLAIEVAASEPAGGIVAGLLDLPGAPPVSLSVNGEGPLGDFTADGSLDLGSERAATVSARVTTDAIGRRIQADIQALTAPFVPQQYIDIVGAEGTLAVNLVLREDGVILVDEGRLVSGNLQLEASGTLDRNGAGNDLTLALRTDEGNPVPIRFGEEGGRVLVEVTSLDATLAGAFASARLDASAAARTAGFEDYLADGVTARIQSAGFDLNALAGPFSAEIAAEETSAPATTAGEAIAGRVLEGPVALAVDGALSATGVTLNSSSLTTATANAGVSGTAALNFSTFDLALDADVETAALSDAAVPYVGPRTALSGTISRTAEGNLSAQNLAVSGDVLEITGSASLQGETVAADIAGRIDQSALPDANLTGAAAFSLTASGPLDAPAVDLTATADGILVAGRELAGLDARIQGTFSPEAPSGTIAVNGTLEGTPLEVSADFATLSEGERVLSNLLVRQDENTVSGELRLSAANVATGALTLALPDIEAIAALAGQDASGDLAGTVALTADGLVPVADLDLQSGSLTYADTNTLDDAVIDIVVRDYLIAPAASGTVSAGNVASGTLTIADLGLEFSEAGEATAIEAEATVNDVDTALAAALEWTPTGADIRLESLTAAVEDAAVALDAPAEITIRSGTTRVEGMNLSVGEGSLSASGTIGDELDLELSLDAFPLGLANPFVEGLDASGTVTGTASAEGPAANPNAAFALDVTDLETSQTRAANLDAIEGRIAGAYDDGTTTLEAARITLGTGVIEAAGTVGDDLDLELVVTDLPVSLADGFVEGLDASGTVDGRASATGSLENPSVVFQLGGEGISAGGIAASGVDPLSLDISGDFRNGTARIETARIDVGDGEIVATGSVGRDLDLQLRLNAVPVALANGFVDDLDASGTISGEATATGSLIDPVAAFALTGNGITAPRLRRSGIDTVGLDISGGYADATLTIEAAEVEAGGGSLRAAGSVGETIDLRLAVESFPVALANAYRPDLDATGSLSGEATATGTFADPQADFTLASPRITAAPLVRSGIDAVALDLSGAYADGTLAIRTAEVQAGGGSLSASGSVGETLDLRLALDALPVGIANAFVDGLDASGTISGEGTATGSLSDPNATFTVASDGLSAAPLRQAGIDTVALDVAGAYADDTATIERANVRIGEGSITASGTVGEALNLRLALAAVPVAIANAYLPDLGAAGTISGEATATGSLSDPNATFTVTGDALSAAPLRQAGIDTVALDVAGAYADATATISQANIRIGEGSITASGTVGESLDLQVALDALPVAIANAYLPDLDASGTISGEAVATGSLSDPNAIFTVTSDQLSAAPLRQAGIDTVALDVAGAYAGDTATIERANIRIGEGSITASGTVGDALDIEVALTAVPVAVANGFVEGLGAEGTVSGTASATGSLADPSATFDLSASGVSVEQTRAAGLEPVDASAIGSFADGTATIETARVGLGGGEIVASGTVGDQLDVAVTLDAVPVAIANGFVEGLGAQGSISGTASATGSLTDPSATFDLSASGVSVAQTRAAGLDPIDATAAGAFADGTATVDTARIGLGGGEIVASGTVGDQLDVDVTLSGIPASLLGAVAPGLAPTGTIAGSVSATGSLTDPSVTYDLSVSALTLQPTRDAGVGPLDISAAGTFADDVVQLDADLSGGGLAFSANGSVGIAGTPAFDIALDGTAPLSLANFILAEGGRSVDGIVAVDVQVSGTAAAPDVTGTVSTSGASFVDTGANIAVNDIATLVTLTGQSATISSFSAELSSGGTVSVGGTVGLTGGFPADLAITVDDGRYADGELLSIQLDATLTFTGDITGSPVLAGTIDAEEINILVPDNLPTSLARIDVRRVNAPPAVLQQLREINPDSGASGNTSGGITLDIAFNAPNRVFVRGRGLDLELGGSVDIEGPISALAITGGFELQRGRFQILSRRLDFERATLTFNGDLLPTLDLLAVSDAGDVTVYVAITGPATDPSFSFSSAPTLPQDEVLARLIFGQATADLSPLQIAQLASAAAQLAGVGGSTGLLDNLRAQLGVDDLDIRTNADGQTAVGVGRYINENTYVGVDSTGRVSIDLELGANVKARGAVTASGGGEVGIFYEREY